MSWWQAARRACLEQAASSWRAICIASQGWVPHPPHLSHPCAHYTHTLSMPTSHYIGPAQTPAHAHGWAAPWRMSRRRVGRQSDSIPHWLWSHYDYPINFPPRCGKLRAYCFCPLPPPPAAAAARPQAAPGQAGYAYCQSSRGPFLSSSASVMTLDFGLWPVGFSGDYMGSWGGNLLAVMLEMVGNIDYVDWQSNGRKVIGWVVVFWMTEGSVYAIG